MSGVGIRAIHVFSNLILPKLYKVSASVIPILKRRKLRHREHRKLRHREKTVTRSQSNCVAKPEFKTKQCGPIGMTLYLALMVRVCIF